MRDLWSRASGSSNVSVGRRTPGETFRDRPVYTYAGDREPGDANGDAYGEFNGYRNGFKAFWLRDDFRNNAMVR